jgi:hypothetical protein
MGLEAAFNMLESRLHALLETLTSLHTTIVEDRPPQNTPALVDIIGDSAEDLVGWTIEALAIARDAQQASLRGDMDALRRALAGCHDRTTHVAQCLVADLMPYERIADLARVGRTRGGEWRAWASSVKQAIDSCRQPLFDLQQAQFECWQEVAERNGRQSILMQAVDVGR